MRSREKYGGVVVLVQNGDIIQLQTVGELQAQVVRNVFQYSLGVDTGGVVNIADVIPLWFIGFDTAVLRHLSDTVVVNSVQGVNLTNPVAIYEGNVSASGDVPGECLPVHDTMSVKLIRSTALTRNGRKAYSGIPESQTADGNITYSAGIIDPLEAWHSDSKVIAVPDDPSINITFTPVIVGRTLGVDNVYRLDLTKINPIIGAQVNARVRTQNTRKF